jgi:hypothetical protein
MEMPKDMEADVGSVESGAAAVNLVRPLGAFERLFYRFTEANPGHFVLVARFGVELPEGQLRAALRAVQKRHALLSVQVEDRPGDWLSFYRNADVPAPELTVFRDSSGGWEPAAAAELTRPFDRRVAPLMRATLVVDDVETSTLLLTFDEAVADGISATFVLRDLVSVLNGEELPVLPVPLSQEEMIARALPAAAERGLGELPAVDARMAARSAMRPFDATAPQVETTTLSPELTAVLIQRCRQESATVHAAVVVASSRIRAAVNPGTDYVRVLTPVSIRRQIGAPDECVDYFTNVRTGMEVTGGGDFWEAARALSAELARLRSVPVVEGTTGAGQQYVSSDAGSWFR